MSSSRIPQTDAFLCLSNPTQYTKSAHFKNHRFYPISLVIAFFSYFNIGFAFADEPQSIKVHALKIVGLHEYDGSGLYDRIISGFQGHKSNVTMETVVYPPARAFKYFWDCEQCCISPATLDEPFPDFFTQHQQHQFSQSAIFGHAAMALFSEKGDIKTLQLSDFSGGVLGLKRGMPYSPYLDHYADVHEIYLSKVETIEQNILRYKAGKIDGFLAFIPDAYLAFNKLELDVLPNRALVYHPDSIVCKNVPDEYLKEFNDYLKNTGQARERLTDLSLITE